MALLQLFQDMPAAFVAFCTVLGLLVGSFLNVVVHRLPRMMEAQWRAQCAELSGAPSAPGATFNLAVPRSRCSSCDHRIAALENIPILSFLWLRGRCSACASPIGVRYPLVEAASGALCGLAAWQFGPGLATAGALVFCWAMLALALIDLDTQLLPDDITLPLVWAGLLLNLQGTFVPLSSAVLGAAAGYLCLWCVFWGFKLLTGKDGMGFGDFKLLGAIGAWLGWKMILPVLLLSSVAGATLGITLILAARHGRRVPIPFGPYLAIAGTLALFSGPHLLALFPAGL